MIPVVAMHVPAGSFAKDVIGEVDDDPLGVVGVGVTLVEGRPARVVLPTAPSVPVADIVCPASRSATCFCCCSTAIIAGDSAAGFLTSVVGTTLKFPLIAENATFICAGEGAGAVVVGTAVAGGGAEPLSTCAEAADESAANAIELNAITINRKLRFMSSSVVASRCWAERGNTSE